MKARNTLFAVLMLSLPAISAEHSEMKMTDMSTSASSQEYMAGMKDMHDKMMTAVNESDPDKANLTLFPTCKEVQKRFHSSFLASTKGERERRERERERE